MADEDDVNGVPAAQDETKDETVAAETADPDDTAEPSEDEGQEAEDGEETTDEAGEEPAEEQEPAKPVGRAQARIQKLAQEKDAERAEKEKAINERAVAVAQLELLREQQRSVQSDAQRRAEDERLALLAPEDRALHESNQRVAALEYRLNQMEISRQDDQDRANFHAKAAHDEVYKKYADDIEAAYQDGKNRGVTAPREELLAWKLGKELLKNRQTATTKKKETAVKRIESVTSKPVNARGGTTGAKTSKTEEDRLRGVLI